MNSFKEKLLRLKNELKLQDDKDIAEILGLGVKAFSARKSRGSFPEKELFALKAKRPELDLDVDYILLGARREVFEKIEEEMRRDMPAQSDLLIDPNRPMTATNEAENVLLQYFRLCDKQGRETILNVAKGMLMMKLGGE